MTTKITHNSLVSIGLMLTLAGVIFSAGIVYNMVVTTREEVKELKKETKDQFTSLNEKIDKLVSLRVASFPIGSNIE